MIVVVVVVVEVFAADERTAYALISGFSSNPSFQFENCYCCRCC